MPAQQSDALQAAALILACYSPCTVDKYHPDFDIFAGECVETFPALFFNIK